MDQVCERLKGTSLSWNNFKITLTGYNKKTVNPRFTIIKKGHDKAKYDMYYDDKWICMETKTSTMFELKETDEGTPDLDHFFQTSTLNRLVDQLFDMIDQDMIFDLRSILGSRCYKTYLGLENPPFECIDQVSDILDKPDLPEVTKNHWKRWLTMCMNTCVDQERYQRALEVWEDRFLMNRPLDD